MNGLARNSMPGSRTPSRTMPFSVWPDMYRIRMPGRAAASFEATSRPLIPGMTTSVSSSFTSASCGTVRASSPFAAARIV